MSGYTLSELPAGWNQWKVSGYRGKNRDENLGVTFVRADTEEAAKRIGHAVLRMRVRGVIRVEARPYRPWLDIAWTGYIGRVITKNVKSEGDING